MTEYVQYFQAIGWPQGLDWLWILLVALLIFGGKKLPEIARSLGKSLNEFKKGIKEAEDTKDEVVDDVKKVKDDIVRQTKDAAGLDDLDNKT
jgi:sec-independent protein translocase protein TatA